MNAISIKNHLKAAACAAALLLAAACSNELPQDDGANPNGNPNEGTPLTLTASVPGGEGANTRISYDDKGTSGVKLTWTEGDAFRLYTKELSQQTSEHAGQFTWQSGGTANQFKGMLLATKPDDSDGYAAYYPASKFPETPDGTMPKILLTGQVQTGNNSMAHLADYNFMSASGISDLTGNIQFGPLLTLLTFDLTMPADVTTLNAPTQLKIAASKASGPSTVFTSTLFGSTDASELSIDLKNIKIGADQKLKVYILVQPFELNGDDFTITVGDYKYKTPNVTKSYQSERYTATVADASWTKIEAMKFTVTTTTANMNCVIPFPTSGKNPANITVNWGDGTTITEVEEGAYLFRSDRFNHKYAIAGTYQITVTSDKPATEQQIPSFLFCDNRDDSKDLIVSFDTPLLNMNQENLTQMFYECTNLAKVDAGLFAKNTNATNFDRCFTYCQELTEIPAGLFEKNTSATNFSECFHSCYKLARIPAGLFAKNTNVTSFSACFAFCRQLIQNENIFIDEIADKNTRFKDKDIDFSFCFNYAGSEATIKGIAPDLWNYTMGGTVITKDCFNDCNMSNTMPTDQKKAWGAPKRQ